MADNNILLGVNVDHVATVRQARYREIGRACGQIVEPDPIAWALAAERAGADGITMHLREDRRHMQDEDVRRMRACIATRLNLEMACTEEMTAFALAIKPDFACLVPENRTEVTTEGGLDVAGQMDRVGQVVRTLNDAGIVTSLFIDPEASQIDAAAELGSPLIELHTGAFSNAWHVPAARVAELLKLERAVEYAVTLGLTVNAGHGVNYVNVADIRRIEGIHELNIGHSIVSRALFTGVDEAVGRMKALIRGLL
ncbi:MAG: pyridoxine 5'-phosphate synthase [Opitutales bacterium]|nr:pyridoxine 5'-phosphate synthase [Opitutales bacterium]